MKEKPQPAQETAAGNAGPAVQEEKDIHAATESAADLYGQLLRLKADFENYRKRVDREKPEWIRLGEAGLLSRLLPLYDVLLQAHGELVKASGSVQKELMSGLELLFKEFNKVFESEGVKVIETVGKPYHHDLHEALGSVETDEHPEGTVVEELQRGYLWKDKVLRPARVRIAKPKSKA